ncbi:winged helix-turn-helix transcriptional regulator [Rhodoferax sp. AJA081-3]|uniref:MarR family winged helix-turn-helix transcriptional regulator n=1 Tax=Rhodoferax sp. AJA081-3 TaxID=2752316 RepID=UPI001AE0AD5A|nr:MarR family winged helix-turn-helix transcriptional regulator [Rhodoferax sp. AJA081-3]QTN27126.1 winged helix-turn-helix transcriptional regulator [Rhodoferax sp. AJA081-3]
MEKTSTTKNDTPYVDTVDTSFLETLVGYNARRTALFVIEQFMPRMAAFDLRTVDFSVLSLITHNPGITSRQLCGNLNILAPNLVAMVNALEKKKLIVRKPHPLDGRAMGLHLTAKGQKLMVEAEKVVNQLELDATAKLSAAERKTLLALLKKVYK